MVESLLRSSQWRLHQNYFRVIQKNNTLLWLRVCFVPRHEGCIKITFESFRKIIRCCGWEFASFLAMKVASKLLSSHSEKYYVVVVESLLRASQWRLHQNYFRVIRGNTTLLWLRICFVPRHDGCIKIIFESFRKILRCCDWEFASCLAMTVASKLFSSYSEK